MNSLEEEKENHKTDLNKIDKMEVEGESNNEKKGNRRK